MNFIKHSNLEGQHAFLSASSYHWLNYDDNKLISVYNNWTAAQRGTELHEFAATCIRLGQKLPETTETLNMYVNDAIGFRLTPETILYYSENCFGTADAIGFRNGLLRIHDLKTGATVAHMEQLRIYAALFCLEYAQKPKDISFELRIYQNDDIVIENAEQDEIASIMDIIIHFDKLISKEKEKGM